MGLPVDIAEVGQQALVLAHQNRCALILMDMQMLVMNGIEATKSIREESQNRKTPILAMTVNAVAGGVNPRKSGGETRWFGMAASAKLPRLLPCLRVSPLCRVKGALRQAAKGRSLPLTRLQGLPWSHRPSIFRAKNNLAARFARILTAINKCYRGAPVDPKKLYSTHIEWLEKS